MHYTREKCITHDTKILKMFVLVYLFYDIHYMLFLYELTFWDMHMYEFSGIKMN